MIYWSAAIFIFIVVPLFNPFPPVCVGVDFFGSCIGMKSNVANDILHLFFIIIALVLAYLGWKAKGKRA